MSENKSIGCLWRSTNEKIAFSGNIEINGEKVKIVVFKNSYKKVGDTAPDFKIYLSKPKEANSEPAATQESEYEPF